MIYPTPTDSAAHSPAPKILKRKCAYCKQELTDPVSLELGVGPVCRQKDNHLYALTIPADVELAWKSLKALPQTFGGSDGWAERLQNVKTVVLAQRFSEKEVLDWREVVQALVWLGSCVVYNDALRAAVVATIAALGYPGVAGRVGQLAIVGEAVIGLSNSAHYFSLQGSKNTHFEKALLATVKADFPKSTLTTHSLTPYSLSGKKYLIHVSRWAAVQKLLPTFYPFATFAAGVSAESLAAEAKAAAQGAKMGKPVPFGQSYAVPCTPVPGSPAEVTLSVQTAASTPSVAPAGHPVSAKFLPSGELAFKVPYNPVFIADFKAAVAKEARVYNGNTVSWTVQPEGIAAALKVIAQHWPSAMLPVLPAESTK